MNTIKKGVLLCLILFYFASCSINAFAVDDLTHYYWTGRREIAGDDYYHYRDGYYYQPPLPSISARKINITIREKHSYNAHHFCTGCEHECAHYDIAYIMANMPSCTDNGNVECWHCPACNGYFSDEAGTNDITAEDTIIPALGHNYVLGVCSRCHEGDGISGSSGMCGDDAFYWLNSVGELHIYGTGITTDYDSTSLAPWHSQSDSIKNIIIEDGITSIGSYAFTDCSNLTSISFPQTISSIGNDALSNCNLLTDVYYRGRQMGWVSVTLGENNDKLTSASFHCFHTISVNSGFVGGTVSATVANEEVNESIDGTVISLTIIPDADYELETLSVKMGDSEISVENNCFTMPAGDVDVIAIFHVTGIWGRVNWSLNSNGLLSISGNGKMVGFSSMSQDAWHAYSPDIRTVEVENGIISIGNYAFYACNEITDIFIASDVSNIGEYAFSNCSNLKNLTMPSNVMSIGSGAFQNCTSLVSITIPTEIATINSYTFSGCNNMKHMSIPLSVKHIGESAFQGCSALTDVYYYGTLEQWNAIVIEDDNDFLTCADIHCITTPDFMLPAALTTIGDEAFAGGAFVYVELPEQTASIGWHAFADCPNLKYIYIPAMTTQIDEQAFGDMQELVIIGKVNTAAQTYALDHSFSFIAVS